ncbi:hypothetical protein AAG906_027274 [Vitis piasezkii]
MAIVSSHSWSLFLEIRRKSSSLSHIKLNKTSEEAISTLHCLTIRGQEPSLRMIQHLRPPRPRPFHLLRVESQNVAPQLRGPGLQALDSRLDLYSLILGPLPILSVLLACHATTTGASGFIWIALEVPSRAPYDSQGVLLPRVALDFYQSMITHGAQSPITIHFSIDGRQGILEARHVAQALHIPYEPVNPTNFRE